MNDETLRARIRAYRGSDGLAKLLDDLRADPDAERLLGRLAASGNLDERMWVVGAARSVLGRGASGLLVGRLRDRDSDVRGEALSELMLVDPEAARRQFSRIVRWLDSDDFYEPVDAMWALAMLGDPRAVPRLQEAATRWGPRDFRSRIAGIVVDVINGNHDAIFEALRARPHRRALARRGRPHHRHAGGPSRPRGLRGRRPRQRMPGTLPAVATRATGPSLIGLPVTQSGPSDLRDNGPCLVDHRVTSSCPHAHLV